MTAKKGAKDQLTRALEETPVARKHGSPSDVSERPTPRAQPVGQVLKGLQAQAKDAMPDSLFDDGANDEDDAGRETNAVGGRYRRGQR